MTFGTTMTHTCTVQRGTPATYETAASSAPHLSNQACRYWEESVADETVDRSGGVRMLKRSVLLIPAGVDVKSIDRITSVLDRNGVELLPGTMAINGEPINYGPFKQFELSRVS